MPTISSGFIVLDVPRDNLPIARSGKWFFAGHTRRALRRILRSGTTPLCASSLAIPPITMHSRSPTTQKPLLAGAQLHLFLSHRFELSSF